MVVTLVYSGVVTVILVKIVGALIGIRVTDEEEHTGLDLSQHNEARFNL